MGKPMGKPCQAVKANHRTQWATLYNFPWLKLLEASSFRCKAGLVNLEPHSQVMHWHKMYVIRQSTHSTGSFSCADQLDGSTSTVCRISWLEAPNNTSTFVCCTLTQRDICHVQLPSKTSMVSCNGYANNKQVSWTSFNSLPIVCGMVELYMSNSWNE